MEHPTARKTGPEGRSQAGGTPCGITEHQPTRAWDRHHVLREHEGGLLKPALVISPATETRWTQNAFRRSRERACDRARGRNVSLYEGTKHRLATHAARRGVPERVVQRMLRHRDLTSTRRYARLADDALVYALRNREVTRAGGGLSPRPIRQRNVNENDRF